MQIKQSTETIYKEGDSGTPERLVLSDNDTLELNQDTYKVIQTIGKGGFGSVYKIESLTNGQHLAFKTMNLWEMQPSEFGYLSEKFVQGFKAGRLNSSNIVKSFSLGFIKGNPYIVMEYCEHGNLENRLSYFNAESQIDILARQILNGLNSLHLNGIIHRDLKPANILFDKTHVAKLSDFDLSGHLNKRTTYKNVFGYAQAVYGTIAFSPPEQMDPGKYYKMTLPSMDMYSFGSTMYYVLSRGRNPFGSIVEDINALKDYQNKKKSGKPEPIQNYNPTISNKWIQLLDKCIEPNPKKRVQSVEEALDILQFKIEHTKIPISYSPQNPTLKIIVGEGIGLEFTLDDFIQHKNNGIITVGRKGDNQNTIELEETFTNYISRKQFVLEKTAGAWIVRDGQFIRENGSGTWQYSLNGTFINHKKLNNRDYHLLSNGDIIRVGDFALKFCT